MSNFTPHIPAREPDGHKKPYASLREEFTRAEIDVLVDITRLEVSDVCHVPDPLQHPLKPWLEFGKFNLPTSLAKAIAFGALDKYDKLEAALKRQIHAELLQAAKYERPFE